jgi:hypothetical protein
MNVQSLVVGVVAAAAVVVAVTRIEVAVQTAAVEMGIATGVTKYPGSVNYTW